MSATLHIDRPARLADRLRTYQVVLDGQATSNLHNATSADLPVAPGTHALQIRVAKILKITQRPELASPTVTFAVEDEMAASFTCHPPRFLGAAFWWVRCLLGARNRWLAVENQSQPPRG